MIQSLNTFLARVGERKALWIVAILAFVVQLMAMRSPEIYGEPYLVAKNIVAGKGFVFTYPNMSGDAATCYVTPLYVFLQIPFLILGLGERGIQVFNLVMLQLACFVLYRFFRRFVTAPVAFLAFCAISFYVPFWVLGYALDPNTLNILLLALTIDCLYRLSKDQSTGRWIQLGLLTGVQLLLRPDILVGAACFAVWLLAVSKEKKLVTIKGIASAGLIACIIVAPWTLRNYVTFHKFVLVSANSGFNLYVGNNPTATGELTQYPPNSESTRENASIDSYALKHDQVEVDQYRKALAFDWIFAHPLGTLELDLKKAYYHWFGRNDFGTQYHYYQHSLSDIYLILSVVLIGFGGVGLFRLSDPNVRSLLLALFVYSTLVSSIFFVQSRHRALKVDPYLVPLAVIGICQLATRREHQHQIQQLALHPNEY